MHQPQGPPDAKRCRRRLQVLSLSSVVPSTRALPRLTDFQLATAHVSFVPGSNLFETLATRASGTVLMEVWPPAASLFARVVTIAHEMQKIFVLSGDL